MNEVVSYPTCGLWCESDWLERMFFLCQCEIYRCACVPSDLFSTDGLIRLQIPVVFFTSLTRLIVWCDLHGDYPGMLSEQASDRGEDYQQPSPGDINSGMRV